MYHRPNEKKLILKYIYIYIILHRFQNLFFQQDVFKIQDVCPLGTEFGATQVGNIMAARVAILLLVAGARGIHWLLEQPKGSMFQYHPQIEAAIKLLRCWRKHIKMGSFGAATDKPTWLYSSWGLRVFIFFSF